MGKVGLIHFEEAQKDLLVEMVANHYPISEVKKTLEDMGAYPYTDTAYRKYLKSDEGKRKLAKEREKISEEAKEHSFSDRGGRIAVLAEISTKLLEKLRSFQKSEVGGRAYLQVSGELRSTFKDIREEMAKFGEAGQGVDFFESLFTTLRKMEGEHNKLPSFIRDTLGEDNFLLMPSIGDQELTSS